MSARDSITVVLSYVELVEVMRAVEKRRVEHLEIAGVFESHENLVSGAKQRDDATTCDNVFLKCAAAHREVCK